MASTKTVLVNLLAATVLAIPVSDIGVTETTAVFGRRTTLANTDFLHPRVLQTRWSNAVLVSRKADADQQMALPRIQLRGQRGGGGGGTGGGHGHGQPSLAQQRKYVQGAAGLLKDAKTELHNSYVARGKDRKELKAAQALQRAGQPGAADAVARERHDLKLVHNKIKFDKQDVRKETKTYQKTLANYEKAKGRGRGGH